MIRILFILGICLALSGPAPGGAYSITTKPKLIVGGDRNCPPYEFYENGKPTGFDIELMQAVADVMGFEVEFRLGPWVDVRQGLDQGAVDAIAGMFYSVDRSSLVDFSVPHTMVTSGIFVRKGSPIRSYADIQGKEVIVQQGDIIHDSLGRNGLASRIVTVTDVGQAVKLLASGKHDCAILTSRLQGEHFIKTFRLSNLRVINTDQPQLQYCFAVRKDNQQLLYKLDEGLKILKVNGKYREIYEKWFGVYERENLWKIAKGYVFAALAVFASLFAAGFAWSRSLRKQVGIRTAELRESEEKFRILAETIPSAIIVYQEDRFVYVNPAVIQATGYSEQECMQMKFWDLASDNFKELVKSRGLARQRGEKIPSQYEYQWVTKSGEKKWAFISSARIEYKGNPAGIAMLIDITDRKYIEEELHRAHAELEIRVKERTDELARATEALMASEKEKSLILNITDDVLLFFDPDMKILWANKAAAGSVDMTYEELRERRCWEAWHQRQEPCVGCPVLLVRDTGQPQEAEMHAPDERVWHIRAYPVKDEAGRLIGMVDFAQDITDRKQMEEALRQANLVVENSPVVLFRWKGDDKWPVEMVSGNIIQFGYSPDEFLSGSITYSSIILPDDLERVTRELHAWCHKGVDQFCLEYRILTKDGDIRWVNKHANIERDVAGGVKNFEGIVIDITERKLAEEELERKKSRLQELNSTLENRVQEEVGKNREKDILLIQQNRQAAMGDLLEHIAHQWKQPLTVVSLIIQSLWFSFSKNELTAATIQETINTTTDLLEHMAQTIEVFRDFYRPDKEKTVFSINDSVDNALAFISPALKHDSIAVDVDIDPDLLAIGYPREYIQVLLNVLSNAREELIEKKPEDPKITIRGVAEGTQAVVTITDNAGGISDSVIHSIFDLYVTTREAKGGTGIGLHMSKNIIEKNMDGSLTAHNTDSGAQFRIAINMPEWSASAGTDRQHGAALLK
ncbi:MAG: transporter substrate-binding domain-containing protein [Pedobacter sp.]